MKKVLLILFCIISISSNCFAETKEFISEGTYTMGDNETPLIAEEKALLQAKRSAIRSLLSIYNSKGATHYEVIFITRSKLHDLDFITNEESFQESIETFIMIANSFSLLY